MKRSTKAGLFRRCWLTASPGATSGTAPTAIINGTTSTRGSPSPTATSKAGGQGSGNINLDPVFANAAGADGIVGNADDDLHIRASSPAVDAGDNTASGLSGITTDFAGNARFVDVIGAADTGVGTVPIVDMGAYEAAAGMDADAFGPYRVAAGGTFRSPATATATKPEHSRLHGTWMATASMTTPLGPSPTFSAAGITGATTITIGVQITDTANQTKTDSATLKVIPSVMYVDDSAVGTNNGGTWTNAYTSLQSRHARCSCLALKSALHKALYKPTTGIDWWTSFDLKSGISLIGGYAGVARPIRMRDYNANPTILSGDIGLPGDSSDNTNQIVTVHAGRQHGDHRRIYDYPRQQLGNHRQLCRGGNGSLLRQSDHSELPVFTEPSLGQRGGLGDNASGTITNCVFQGNLAGTGGGGAFIGSISNHRTTRHRHSPTAASSEHGV